MGKKLYVSRYHVYSVNVFFWSKISYLVNTPDEILRQASFSVSNPGIQIVLKFIQIIQRII